MIATCQTNLTLGCYNSLRHAGVVANWVVSRSMCVALLCISSYLIAFQFLTVHAITNSGTS